MLTNDELDKLFNPELINQDTLSIGKENSIIDQPILEQDTGIKMIAQGTVNKEIDSIFSGLDPKQNLHLQSPASDNKEFSIDQAKAVTSESIFESLMTIKLAPDKPFIDNAVTNFMNGARNFGYTAASAVEKLAPQIDSLLQDEGALVEFLAKTKSDLERAGINPTSDDITSAVFFSLGAMIPEAVAAAAVSAAVVGTFTLGAGLVGATAIGGSGIAQFLVGAGATVGFGATIRGTQGAEDYAILEGLGVIASKLPGVYKIPFMAGSMFTLAEVSGASHNEAIANGILGFAFAAIPNGRKPLIGEEVNTQALAERAGKRDPSNNKSINEHIIAELPDKSRHLETTISDHLNSPDINPRDQLLNSVQEVLGDFTGVDLSIAHRDKVQPLLNRVLSNSGLEPKAAEIMTDLILNGGDKASKLFQIAEKRINDFAARKNGPETEVFKLADGTEIKVSLSQKNALIDGEKRADSNLKQQILANNKAKQILNFKGLKLGQSLGSKLSTLVKTEKMDALIKTKDELYRLFVGNDAILFTKFPEVMGQSMSRLRTSGETAIFFLTPHLKKIGFNNMGPKFYRDLSMHVSDVTQLETYMNHKEIALEPKTRQNLEQSRLRIATFRKEAKTNAYTRSILEKSSLIFKAFEEAKYRQLADGILSQKQITSMEGRNYSPLMVLKELEIATNAASDPGYNTLLLGSTIKNIRGELETNNLKIDVQSNLMDFYGRMEYMRNRHNLHRELRNYAEMNPENGMILLNKPEAETTVFEPVSFLENGKTQLIYVDRDIRTAIDLNPTATDKLLSGMRANKQIIGLLTGATPVRFGAIALNPIFGLVSLPRDLIMMSFANPYKYTLPNPLRFKELYSTIKDVTTNGPKSRTYGENGGAKYMSVQEHFSTVEQLKYLKAYTMTDKVKKSYTIAIDKINTINTLMETSVRVHTMDWLIKNTELTPKEATGLTNTMLDFKRRGKISEFIDHFIPFFNVTVQATDAIYRSAKKNPKAFAAKSAQLFALQLSASYISYAINPEGYKDLSIGQKTRNMNFMLPNDISIPGINIDFQTGALVFDSNSQARHAYIPIKNEVSAIPTAITTMAHALFDTIILDKDTSSYFEKISDSLPQIGLDLIPSVKALKTFLETSNRVQQFKPETPEYWKSIGSFFGVSPLALERSVKQYFPSNMFSTLFGLGLEGSSLESEKSALKLISELPVFKKLVKFTYRDRNNDRARVLNDRKDKFNRVIGPLNKLLYELGGDRLTLSSAVQSVNKADWTVEEKKRAKRKLINFSRSNKISKRLHKENKNLWTFDVAPADWAVYYNASSIEKAIWFADKYRDADQKERSALVIMATLHDGFWKNKSFRLEFRKLQRDQGF